MHIARPTVTHPLCTRSLPTPLPQADCGPKGCMTEAEALPWFLQFTSGYEQPRPDLGGADTRHMLCRLVEQKRVREGDPLIAGLPCARLET
jgi:hypothetical protein